MLTAQGTADHCQNTSRVSGGGSNSSVSTTYIVLFRLAQQQVQFSSNSPLPVSDGDQMIVAGRLWRGELYADAVHNTTTGLTRQAGIFSRIVFAVILVVFGFFLMLWLSRASAAAQWTFLVPVLGALYLLWRAVQITRAWLYVRSVAS